MCTYCTGYSRDDNLGALPDMLGRIIGVALATALAFAASGPACSWPKPQSPAVVYPDSVEGLQQFLHELLDALGKKNDGRVNNLLSGLVIPNHTAWFAKVFGNKEGARMEAQYAKELENSELNYRNTLELGLREGGSEIQVSRWMKPNDPGTSELTNAVLAAMKEPIALYAAGTSKGKGGNAVSFGFFFHVDGAFRKVALGVLSALSTAPPLRLRIGGNVQSSKMIASVAPTYPIEAKQQGIQGVVRLQAVIARDGTIKELSVLSGHPMLTEAALAAVRQWRFQTTLLNGVPVEVVTTIDVVFTLSP